MVLLGLIAGKGQRHCHPWELRIERIHFIKNSIHCGAKLFPLSPPLTTWIEAWEALRKTGCFYKLLFHTSSTARCCNLIKKKKELRIWKRFTSDAVTPPQCCCHQHCCVSNSGEHYCNVRIEKSGFSSETLQSCPLPHPLLLLVQQSPAHLSFVCPDNPSAQTL